MPSVAILSSYSLAELRKEISKTNIKKYSSLKKADVIELMLKSEHKDKFHHLKMKEGKAPKSATQSADSKPVKAEPKKKKIKLIKKEEPKPKGIDYRNVEEKLDKAFINNAYQDYIEMFLDGKGSTDKQQDRAGKIVGRAITRVLKKTVKEKKFKTDKELIDYWIKNKKDMGGEL